MSSNTKIEPAPGLDFFYPLPPNPTGKAVAPEGKPLPKAFQPITVKKLTYENRLGVSPMCQYSAGDNYEMTPYHLIHHGAFVTRGAFPIVEATSVSPEGGLLPQDLGLWNDQQAEKMKPVVAFAHANRQVIGIQLAHGGRKASGQPPYVHLEQKADELVGGWPLKIVAPLAREFRPYGNYPRPNELSKDDIKRIIGEWRLAAHRAVYICGYDFIEIHGAHGYLINEFLSSTLNKRTDEYGGSFENRTRFLLEVIDAVKEGMGAKFGEMPLWLRISASENSPEEDAWTIEDSKKLAFIVAERGVDVLDVSSGGNSLVQMARSDIKHEYPMHVPLAKAIKEAVGDKLLVATVGGLHDPILTNEFLEKGWFDFALNGRAFQTNPGLVITYADALGVDIELAREYQWGKYTNKQQIIDLIARSEAEAKKHAK